MNDPPLGGCGAAAAIDASKISPVLAAATTIATPLLFAGGNFRRVINIHVRQFEIPQMGDAVLPSATKSGLAS